MQPFDIPFAINVAAVDFSYWRGQTKALRSISLRIAPGAFVAVVGPNGGGKTTLVRLLLGLLTPTAGSVRVLGLEPRAAAKHIGYVPQRIEVRPDFPATALDVVRMGLVAGLRAPSKAEALELAEQALTEVGMASKAAARLGDLSGGQRQRVFIARALVSRPKLLLLDEPTASVDPAGRHQVYELLASLTPEATVVAVTHDLSILGAGVNVVACVNQTLHAHAGNEIDQRMLELLYGAEAQKCLLHPLTAHTPEQP